MKEISGNGEQDSCIKEQCEEKKMNNKSNQKIKCGKNKQEKRKKQDIQKMGSKKV